MEEKRSPLFSVSASQHRDDALATEQIVEEEKQIEEQNEPKSQLVKTTSFLKILTNMFAKTDWKMEDSIGLAYYLNFKKEENKKDFYSFRNESLQFNVNKYCLENDNETLTIDELLKWKDYLLYFRTLFKDFKNFNKIEKEITIVEFEPKGNKLRSGYSICIDTKRKQILLFIDGTRSFHDLLTDLNADATDFGEYISNLTPLMSIDDKLNNSNNIHNKHFVHCGMLERANWFYMELIPKIEKLLSEKEYKDYPLTLIGHSLGAGVSSILTLMILSNKDPKLKVHCYAISCPKIFSYELSRLDVCKEHITTLAYQDDFIPRFSVESFNEFKKHMGDWKSEIMNETAFGNFIKNVNKGVRQSGVVNVFNNMKASIQSGFNYLWLGSSTNNNTNNNNTNNASISVNSSDSDGVSVSSSSNNLTSTFDSTLDNDLSSIEITSVTTFSNESVTSGKVMRKKSQLPPLPNKLLKKQEKQLKKLEHKLVKHDNFMIDDNDQEDEEFFNTLIKEYGIKEDEQQQEANINEEDSLNEEKEEEEQSNTEQQQEETKQEEKDESLNTSTINCSVTQEESNNNDNNNNNENNEVIKKIELPPLPNHLVVGIHLYSPGKIYHLREINHFIFVRPSQPEDFEKLDFSGNYVSDHFSRNYASSIELLLLQCERAKQEQSTSKNNNDTTIAESTTTTTTATTSTTTVVTNKVLPPIPSYLKKQETTTTQIEAVTSTTSSVSTTNVESVNLM
ncbi:hypothetical protein ABK040_004501 [Willaertia magna]